MMHSIPTIKMVHWQMRETSTSASFNMLDYILRLTSTSYSLLVLHSLVRTHTHTHHTKCINAELEMTIIRFIHMQSVFEFAKFYSFIVKIRHLMAGNVTPKNPICLL